MRRRGFFPDEPLWWYLFRGLSIGLGFGVFLGGILFLLLWSMGDGAGVNPWTAFAKSLLLPILGWAILGPLGGVLAWAISLGANRRR